MADNRDDQTPNVDDSQGELLRRLRKIAKQKVVDEIEQMEEDNAGIPIDFDRYEGDTPERLVPMELQELRERLREYEAQEREDPQSIDPEVPTEPVVGDAITLSARLKKNGRGRG